MFRHQPKLVLPYEPAYTGHREAEQRHREILAFLHRREEELQDVRRSPPTAPSGQKRVA